MKKALLFLFAFLPILSFSQTPQWTWAKTHALSSNGAKDIVASDSQGNVYVAGDFGTTSITIGTVTLTNPDALFGLWQIYLAKYDINGNLLWARSYGSSDNDTAVSLAVDNSGHVYLMGTFQNTTSIDGIILSTVYTNGFVAKLDGDGNAIWAKTNDGGYDGWSPGNLTVDSQGNVYFSGDFASQTLSFGSNGMLTYQGFTGTDYNVGIPFLVKLDANGQTVWARSAIRGSANTGGNFSRAIAVDAQESVFVAGGFMVPTLQFGNITLTKAIASNWNCNMYLVKYDSNGNVLWAKNGGTQYENVTMAFGLAVDNANNVVVAGTFCNTIDWDGVSLTASNGSGPFLLKYDTNGEIQWGKTPFGNQVTVFRCVRTDAAGNVYAAGNTGSTSETFGTGVTLTTASPGAAFIVKYNALGNAVWVQKAGPVGSFNESSMSVVNENQFYLSGTFTENQINFGSIPLAKNQQTNYNRFVARMLHTPLGLEEVNASKFDVFPNPTDGNFFVSGIGENTAFEISDAIGRHVKSGMIASESQPVDISSLPSGVFYLKLQTSAQSTSVQKIVKR